MTKLRLLLLSSAALMLLGSSANAAVTVFSISGTPTECVSTGGNLGDPTTGIVTAASWSQASGYSNVAISAAIETFSDSYTQFTAYLTTSVGTGTTAAQEIAHTTVTAPLVVNFTTTLTNLFTGLTLPPGTYYLTIYGELSEPRQGPECWTYSIAPTVVADTGVSNILNYDVLGVSAYPPASFNSGGSPATFLAQVTGDPIAPPSFSKAFGQPTLFASQTTPLTFTIANSNTLALNGLAFSDTLPVGLVVANVPGITDTCGGTVTAVPGSSSISLSGGNVAAAGTCTIGVTVAGLGSGLQNNVTSVLTSTQAAAAAPASASILVFLTLDGSFQVSYAADPAAGESYINIINDGAQGAPLLGPGFGTQTGNICVQVYAFAPDEQEISCCTCTITPNAVANLGVNRDLTSNTLTNVIPTSVVVKLVAINPTSTASGSCTAAQEGTPVSGMVAYGTTPQPLGTVFNVVEHSFRPSTLSTGPTTGNNEYASITGRCAAILGNGSSFGVCNSCKSGALGAAKQ